MTDCLPLTANALVTPPVPFGRQKHAPVTIRFCIGTPQLPSLGVTEKTTGALTPKAIGHTTVRVNGPNMLLSPAVNVVVTVNVAAPPQQAVGKAVPGKAASGLNVALTRFLFTGVTAPSAIVASTMPSPLVSQARVTAVETVLPLRCSGTPVSDWKPWQIMVVSLGKNPQPTMLACTAHSASIRSVPWFGAVTNAGSTTIWHSGLAGGSAAHAEEAHLAAIEVALSSRCAKRRVVAFEPKVEVRRGERYLAARSDGRVRALVEQLEQVRLSALADQTRHNACRHALNDTKRSSVRSSGGRREVDLAQPRRNEAG